MLLISHTNLKSNKQKRTHSNDFVDLRPSHASIVQNCKVAERKTTTTAKKLPNNMVSHGCYTLGQQNYTWFQYEIAFGWNVSRTTANDHCHKTVLNVYFFDVCTCLLYWGTPKLWDSWSTKSTYGTTVGENVPPNTSRHVEFKIWALSFTKSQQLK